MQEPFGSELLRRRLRQDSEQDMSAARGAVDSHVTIPQHLTDGQDGDACLDRATYPAARARVLARERAMGFDARCRARATPLEARANRLLVALRRRDDALVYACAAPRTGHAGQTHPRFAADHFLANLDLVPDTALFDVACHLPKGAHLHIHYNACLPPAVLLRLARGMERMFVTSDRALVPDDDGASFDGCELQFSILGPDAERPGDIFAHDYTPRQTMRFSDFLDSFPRHYPRANVTADRWLEQKLVFSEDEAYGPLQTADGAWQKFNGRTRMMKGLFNYETAYRTYTRLFLEDLARDGILYAEIRPNFMRSNQLYRDDGSGTIDNRGIMRILIDVVSRFRAEVVARRGFFGGVKVIYCTPRVFSPDEIGAALEECLEFKKQWPEWIAGFDLVGEESKGRPLKDFAGELLDFKHRCAAAGVEIPLLLHCGETLEVGSATDGNVVDALLLGARRIGHGFALARHPHVMQQMKARGVCLELCPISNEILGLTPRVGGHAMYALLANNVHCTVNSDNGALFRSTLSHDFYQVMVGKADMDLYGWKQLVLWSMEHACLDEAERGAMLREWERQWDEFLEWMLGRYGDCEGDVEAGDEGEWEEKDEKKREFRIELGGRFPGL
ncbi:adenosine/AMP deaminase domain-containing protein [Hirsutella rhossiliensis]|uniref:adenosine deaminase n=1 Tax=Hirsutella rhossiliensis TaxID=111463 RepID=A0A9P8MQF1_9HYPO|nr:adenosine/AMP deaminase domain-containing protein [Hirsutella rhossiliensis]KAH0958574.1 adenosine/AMP deaminase domain-containing protein [Hirsutella rhossiliensis]